ncbi:hypothetical protein EGW08_020249 [Elysia chlorotica]|uniref:Uncharacterized protein n=1 Tax=Elysia chlorotica TaxID=188477 RepID=A0A3S0ZP45_ELYCH|nr:hypothetical protein EGW08_020249 [Elysia chlorotica]
MKETNWSTNRQKLPKISPPRQYRSVPGPSLNTEAIHKYAENLPDAREAVHRLRREQEEDSVQSSQLHDSQTYSLVAFDLPMARDLRQGSQPVIQSFSRKLLQKHRRSTVVFEQLPHKDRRSKYDSIDPRHGMSVVKSNTTLPKTDATLSSSCLDMNVKITSALNTSVKMKNETKERLDNFTAWRVPINGRSHPKTMANHIKWLASCKRLSSTSETVPRIEDFMNRELHRQDCKSVFSSMRIPVFRRDPAVIKWPTPYGDVMRQETRRFQWWWQAEGNTRIEKAGLGSPRFQHWAGFDQAKVQGTRCLITHLAGEIPAHLSPVAPSRVMREATRQWEKDENEKMARISLRRRSRPSKSHGKFDKPSEESLQGNVLPSRSISPHAPFKRGERPRPVSPPNETPSPLDETPPPSKFNTLALKGSRSLLKVHKLK